MMYVTILFRLKAVQVDLQSDKFNYVILGIVV